MLDWFVIITFSRESIKICISFKSSCDKFSYGNLPLVSKEWTNDIVLLEQVDDKIIITIPKKKKISLKERFNQYNGKNLTKDFVWDEAQGKELW